MAVIPAAAARWAVPTAVRARQRLRPLAGGGAAAQRGTARSLERWVASLALPLSGSTASQAATVRAVGLGAPAVSALAGGLRLGALVAVGVGLTAVVLGRSAPARRVAADERELPGVVEAVARQLRAGGSLAQALANARPPASSSSDLPEAWARLVSLVPAVGVGAALDDWARVADRPSVRLAAAALAMAAETGGSPARAVDGVASTLRSRLAVAQELRALSSQARASAAVIALAPLAFGALAGATDDRTAAFFASPSGLVVLGLGLGLDGLGAWWMARICRGPA